MMGEITWNRQISRIVYGQCVSCHRDGGTSFPLMDYAQAREAAEAIKSAVLSRSMPPWGAVKGFSELRDEQGLSEAQIEMIVEWVDTGTGRGNNPRALPEPPPSPAPATPFVAPKDSIAVTGDLAARSAYQNRRRVSEERESGDLCQDRRSAPQRRNRPARVAVRLPRTVSASILVGEPAQPARRHRHSRCPRRTLPSC